MKLPLWLTEPGRRGLLLHRLYSDEDDKIDAALSELEEWGWLYDGSLRGIDLRAVVLPGVELIEADLEEAWLAQSDFHEADLSDAFLAETDFTQANLQGANLEGASLYEATLYDADIQDADLREADLRVANLTFANLSGAKLAGAYLEDAFLRGATIDELQLREARTLVGATLPDGNIYDGRFNLPGDLELAREEGYDAESISDMARFYSMSTQEYEEGQAWVKANPELLSPQKPEKETPGEESSEDDETFEPYPPENPLSYLRLLFGTFKDPERIWNLRDETNNRHDFKFMGAWPVSALLWLPLVSLWIVSASDTDDLASTIGSQQQARAMLLISLGIMLVGFVATALSGQKGRREGTVWRVIAILAAVMFSDTSGVWIEIASLTGYVLALVLTLIVVGRASRVTIFWIASVFLAGFLWTIWDYALWNAPLEVKTSLGTGLTNAMVFWGRFIVAVGIILMLQSWVKSRLLGWLGAPNSDALGLILMISYLIGIGLTLLQIPLPII
jgi:hypothetical protein